MQTVPEGEGESHDIHAHLMSGHCIGSLIGGHDGSQHEADTHEQLFKEDTVANLHQTYKGRQGRSNLVSNDELNADKALRAKERHDAHDTGDHGSQHGGQRGTCDAEGGEAQVTADEQIVQNNIDGIGSDVGAHGDFGIAGTALRRVDSHLDAVEKHTTHNDSKVSHGVIVGLGGGAAELDNRACPHDKNSAECNCCQNNEEKRSEQKGICIVLFLLAAPPRHEGGDGHICCEEQGEPYELRLCGETDGCHCIGAQCTDHQGVHQSGESHKKGFNDGGPSHIECDFDGVLIKSKCLIYSL